MNKSFERLRNKLGITLLDWYIIKMFLKTFFFCIVIILSIAIVFDINEKIDSFMEPDVSMYEIIFHYYMNFIPYYVNIFSPLFVFISVIFFTTNLANNSEIIAILASGVSFKRLLKPYFISALVIACFSFLLINYIIPPSNKLRFDFENKYIRNKKIEYVQSIQLEVAPETSFFLQGYDASDKSGYSLALESFKGREICSRLTARNCKYDTLGHWKLFDFRLQSYSGIKEVDSVGAEMDTIIPINPKDFLISDTDVETLTSPELREYIARQTERGVDNAKLFSIELHKRYATFFFAFILTFIGVVLSAKKVKNGLGFNIAIGLGLCFGYILFITITSMFAVTGKLPPWLAAWFPNFTYIIIGVFLWKKAPR